MTRERKLTKGWSVVTTAAAAVFVLAACGLSSIPKAKSTSTVTPTGIVKIPGGTMTVANGGANYIFPMMGGEYVNVSNYVLIELMFRPLYWFGSATRPTSTRASRSPTRPCTRTARGLSPSR